MRGSPPTGPHRVGGASQVLSISQRRLMLTLQATHGARRDLRFER